jgi:ABC-type antimicrobial peptide transport system permease subunit
LSVFIHRFLSLTFDVAYQIPWIAIIQCIVGVFAITWVTMRFSAFQLRKENIIETIRSENV